MEVAKWLSWKFLEKPKTQLKGLQSTHDLHIYAFKTYEIPVKNDIRLGGHKTYT